MFMPLMGFVAISGAITLIDLNVDQQSNLLEQPNKPKTVVHSLEIEKITKTSDVTANLLTTISPEAGPNENTPHKQKRIVKSNPIPKSEPRVIAQKPTTTRTVKSVLAEPKSSPKMFLTGKDARNEPESSWMK